MEILNTKINQAEKALKNIRGYLWGQPDTV